MYSKAVPQFLNGGLFNAADIGAGYAQLDGDLPLGQRCSSAKTEAQGNDLLLPWLQARPDQHQRPLPFHVPHDVLRQIFLTADHIGIGQGISVPIHVDGLVHGHLGVELFLGAEVHKDLVRYPLLTARHILTNPR